MPKVSIVVPVYNVENYLRECLDSAARQTLEDIEIICVDDGSTDTSGEILDEYAAADPRFVVIHKENGGYGKAMNAGLNKASSDYFVILESDDMMMPDTCEILYRYITQFQADVVRTDYFDLSTGSGKNNLTVRQMSKDFSYYYRLICPNKEREVYAFTMHNWTGIYSIPFLNAHNIRYNETPGAAYQDNGFFFQVFSQTEKLVYIPRPCYCYRIDNPGSSIHDKSKVYTMSEEYGFIREFLSRHPEFEQQVLPAFYARLFRAHYQTYMRIDKEFRPDYCQLMRRDMVEARDAHLLDTGLMLAREREVLRYLLNSTDEFMLAVSGPRRKRMVFLAKQMIHFYGFKQFLRILRKKIKL